MKKIKRLALTAPQADAVLSTQKYKYLEWGRGSGKSFILAFFMIEMVKQMPGATFFLAGNTYSQMLSTTLPSTKQGLKSFNILEDVDYVIGRCGKNKGFAMPLQSPNMWNNIIHFSNGAIFVLISQDNPNAGRGLNTYGGIGDEAALLDPTKLYNQAQTTNRAAGIGTAKEEIFKKAPLLGCEIYASSTPVTKAGKWFTDMEAKALLPENRDRYYFCKASSLSNPNNTDEWYRRVKENAVSKIMYDAEILNIRPKTITDGFYPNLNHKRHYYTDYDNVYLEGQIWVPNEKDGGIKLTCKQDLDRQHNEPLIVSLDFGVFNSCVVSQVHHGLNEYRVLKSMWVKSPELLSDLFVKKFIPYYKDHGDKTVHLYGGHDGNNDQVNAANTLFEQVEAILRAHGWSVYTLTRGQAARHHAKYLLINAILKETQRNLPNIRINKGNCADLIIALEHAEAKEGNNGVEKEKKHERNKSMLQQHTTHLTDAFDVPIYALYNDLFTGSNLTAGESGIILLG
jgi:hypothetical protein